MNHLVSRSRWRRLAPWFPLLVIALLATRDVRAIQQTQNFGPFTVNFYGLGEAFDVYTGQRNWTSEQMADVGASISAWDAGIANTAGRPIRMDAIWCEFGTSGDDQYILGGSYSTRIYGGGTIYNQGESVWREQDSFISGGYDTRIVYDVTAGSMT